MYDKDLTSPNFKVNVIGLSRVAGLLSRGMKILLRYRNDTGTWLPHKGPCPLLLQPVPPPQQPSAFHSRATVAFSLFPPPSSPHKKALVTQDHVHTVTFPTFFPVAQVFSWV